MDRLIKNSRALNPLSYCLDIGGGIWPVSKRNVSSFWFDDASQPGGELKERQSLITQVPIRQLPLKKKAFNNMACCGVASAASVLSRCRSAAHYMLFRLA
jgi:hypothetical protein